MKKIVAIFLLVVILLVIILSSIGCASQKRSKCPTYSLVETNIIPKV